jgi:uncharacterized membrane protein YphA (DoxX/SURF4 family)
MNWLTKTFLVLLRLAIGWHFLFEGLEKVSTYYPAPPHVNRTMYGWPPWQPVHPEARARGKPTRAWSSEAYLRGANGPGADLFHDLAGDTVLDRVEVQPPVADEPNDKAHHRLPVGLEKDWRAYFDALVAHYHVEDKQLDLMKTAFDQRKANTVRWLLQGSVPVRRPAPVGQATVETEVKITDLVRQYKERLEQTEETDSTTDREEFLAEADRLRSELRAAADGQTEEMKKVLGEKLTPAQRAEYGPLPEPVVRHLGDWDRLDWIDFMTRWGLVVIGGCLLLGLFTRTACMAGALFLLMLYLAMPPFPWLPPNPRAEGHYLFVNKNLIEMLAMLVLATTRSGRWVGLDALLQFLGSRSPRAPQTVSPEQAVSTR